MTPGMGVRPYSNMGGGAVFENGSVEIHPA